MMMEKLGERGDKMRKCDICGDESISELIVKGKNGTMTTDICEKCSQLIADAIVNITNVRMKEKFGKNALLIFEKSKSHIESEG